MLNNFEESKRENYSLEITTVLGCSIQCVYCPQSSLVKASKGISERVLTFERFKECLVNVPSHVKIHWTGYSEPCLCKELDSMIDFVHKKGHKQLISTTLGGYFESAAFVSNFPHFSSFTLHLPDKDGLMEGIANKPTYIPRVKRLFQSILENNPNLHLLTFGENFHPEIESIIKLYKQKGVEISAERRNHLHQRAGLIDAASIDDVLNSKEIDNAIAGSQSKKFKFRNNHSFDQIPNKKSQLKNEKTSFDNWYCSYKRLSQPVLLPDGRTNICCQDYKLSCITGDLRNQKYEEIVKFDRFKDDFSSGKLIPCTNCEYYKKLPSEMG